MSTNAPLLPKPALLTKRSIGSSTDTNRSLTSARPSAVVRSAASTSTPANVAARSSNRSARRATTTTGMPARPSSRTIAAPMPLEAPVISADVNGWLAIP